MANNKKQPRFQRRMLKAAENAINAANRYGESRHEAKMLEMKKAQETGQPYQQPRGNFSYNTNRTYMSKTKVFLNFIWKKHPEVRRLRDCKQYVKEYLEDCQNRGLSASTIKTYAHSLACAFGCNVSDFDFMIPRVRRDNIKRTRKAPKAEDFSEKTKDIHRFAVATGARRGGLNKLTTDCLREGADGRLYIYLDEKGGKKRWARVLAGEEDFVRSVIREAEERNYKRGDGCKKVFPDRMVPKNEPLHQHRHEYAHRLYDEVMRNGEHEIADRGMYYCRGSRKGEVFNRTALAIVSFNLGHGQPDEIPHEVRRVGVVVNNYLW